MIPILYKSTETSFTHNGKGFLSDCLKCTVTEERNGVYEAEFTYPITGRLYREITHDRIVKIKANETSELQLFRIYRHSKPINGLVKFYCQHISYDLNKNVVTPFTQTKTNATVALGAILDHCYYAHNFTAVSSSGVQSSIEIKAPVSARNCLGGMKGSILDKFGGEFEFDNFMIRHYSERGQDNGVTIRYGKNLTDITADSSITETYTSVYPYATDEDEEYYELPEKVIELSSSSNYGEPRTLPLDLSSKFDSDTRITDELLRQYANEYITNNKIDEIKQNIKVSFVQLWQSKEYETIALLERVKLCDTVTVEYPALGVSAKAKVIKTVYDSLAEKYEEIELGEAKSNFGDTLSKVNSGFQEMSEFVRTQPSLMEKAIAHATDRITGGLGGYVVIPQNENGYPEEILIMDTSDKTTATNVWRFNKGGLGHSHSGYEGPFNDVALTDDGQINANMITTGKLNADLIQAGVLKDLANKNYWNMATGEFHLSSDVADNVLGDLSQLQIFNKLTNNGETQGIYLQNGKLYLNASYMQTGSINADLIKAGTIQDVAGNMSINMTNGTIQTTLENGMEMKLYTKGLTLSQNNDVVLRLYADENGYSLVSAHAVQANGYIKVGTARLMQGTTHGIYLKVNGLETENFGDIIVGVHGNVITNTNQYTFGDSGLTIGNTRIFVDTTTNRSKIETEQVNVKDLYVYNPTGDNYIKYSRKTVYVQNAETGNMEIMNILAEA